MTHTELDYYLTQGRRERAKAFTHGARWIARTLARAGRALGGSLSLTHQPKVYQ
jgi:cellobiose phosphorylase